MKPAITLLFILLFITGVTQTPFTTYRKHKLKTIEQAHADYGFAINSQALRDATYLDRLNALDTVSLADYLDHMSANIVFIQDAKKMFPTINGEVINYRLGLWTHKKLVNKTKAGAVSVKDQKEAVSADLEPRVHYLPFSIITKVSGNYMDSAAGPINDATSFFGAPLTFRVSPAADLTPTWTENKLFVGMNGDVRLLAFGNDADNTIDVGWGAYVSGGVTYMGKGHAYENNVETGEEKRYNGKWSISTIFYWFKSGGNFNKAIFGSYEKKSLSGVELFLKFKTTKKEDSKFNFLISASNGFTRDAPGFAQWQFRVGVGK